MNDLSALLAGSATTLTPAPVTGDASLFDANLFSQSLSRAEQQSGTGLPDNFEAVLEPLDAINNKAREIRDYAESAVASGNDLTPSEVVMLSAKSQEFMFYCQLSASVANRTSDGLQQLFRQQG